MRRRLCAFRDREPTSTVVPSPGVDDIPTVPPAAVAKPYTWLSPSPDPLPNSLVVKNGSNAWARVASSMPVPLSDTAITT